ncbi:hypothetical protein [Ramlibacter pallidus]|uniref:PIN domain-containing protein n=1 Tax=Ramlibacter pallidus TaxID=2780087 RepID=A0ABR9S5T4_9BURK|nr:hypothetical protein [Ramlibacter pallidus]MBE7368876.1 hypothetical protein [Ramlibacter pallidus]
MNPQQVGSSIDRHRASPEVSLDRHTRSRLLELGALLAPRKAIYLDLCFWILLRDAMRAGKPDRGLQMLSMLRGLVKSGVAFCPISDSTFLELFKQTDSASRVATAELIDELSLGVTLVPFHLRVGTEIAHYVHSAKPGTSVYPLRELTWSKLSYVMGFVHSTKMAFDAATNLAIQKAFFDHMWDNVSLVQMCSHLGEAFVHADPLHFRQTSANLNEQNQIHAADLKSFRKTYKGELIGVLDLFAGTLAQILAPMLPAEAGPLPAEGTAKRADVDRHCLSFLVGALDTEGGRKAMRSLHIKCLLHAAVRWNKGQALKPNDLFDFDHAAAAIGYCDAFFTEGPLSAMLARRDLRLKEDFGCFVSSDADECLRYLEAL